MNWIIGTLLVLFSTVGGSLGWWKGTKNLASPPDRYDRPIGVGRREHERHEGAATESHRCLGSNGSRTCHKETSGDRTCGVAPD